MALLRAATPGDFGPVLETDRVLLRAPQMSDYPAWAELRAASQDFLVPWEPLWAPDELSRASFRRRIRHYLRDMREDMGYALFVYDARSTDLVGGITLCNVRRGVTQSCTLGYWVGEAYARQGYMTAAVRAVVPFVFDSLELHRLEAACLPTNTASMRLLERVGFKKEGLARRYLRINGDWRDHVLYALLESDPRVPGNGG
ncbi:GNAT family N-acetyltransferase [Methyloceanibacter caenitepidi]|uniref:Ribosomal-protein-S5p-alanine acetyltransferase n=1 Tax=Methyloceanibacter caenitepidi TaxID=1384459 RepID=A0A0A8K112_9HYPH|nr:GNAT family protein [Methyloceanibacter caenitepidi]BAQ16456.1 ribosomal-protein-S5p-alanine acetyltransferase [Methyloceanibacter caenitepidi]